MCRETLQSIKTAHEQLCAKIARAEYEFDELGNSHAWYEVADLMRNGFMASIRDEIDQALKQQ